MADIDYDALIADRAAGTPGEWDAALERGCHGVIAAILPHETNFVAIVGNDADTPEREPMRFANARFIAAARDLVPAMADRLAAQEALLKEAVEALRFYADEHYDGYDVCITDYGLSTENGPIITDGGDRARATLAKLRAHLEDR